MADVADFFVQHARISRRTLARFAEVDPGDIDRAADDLGLGPLLRLDEAEEVLAELEDDDDLREDNDEDEEPEPADEDR